MAEGKASSGRQPPPRRWFNWPLALGLAVNSAVWAGLAYWLLHRHR